MLVRGVLAAAAALFVVSSADAELLKFTYKFGATGSTVSGSLIGSLANNGSVFDIAAYRSLSVNGTAVSGNPQVLGTDAYTFGTGNAPTVSLDKSAIDFAITPGTGTSLFFGVGDTLSSIYGFNSAYATPNYGGTGNPGFFDPSALTLSVLQDATLDFSYKFASTGSTVSGSLTGWVSGDGSLFEVGGFQSLSVNGVPVPNVPQVLGTDAYTFGTGNAPAVALDKSVVDFAITPGTGTSLFFGVGDTLSSIYGYNSAYATPNYGGDGSPGLFDPSALTLHVRSLASPAPEPASWALMISGMGIVGIAMRRRQRQTARFA